MWSLRWKVEILERSTQSHFWLSVRIHIRTDPVGLLGSGGERSMGMTGLPFTLMFWRHDNPKMLIGEIQTTLTTKIRYGRTVYNTPSQISRRKLNLHTALKIVHISTTYAETTRDFLTKTLQECRSRRTT